MDFLEEHRLRMAQEAFADYDFGDVPVRGSGSWGHIDGDTIWRMPVYLDQIRRMFVVKFTANSSEVEDCYLENQS